MREKRKAITYGLILGIFVLISGFSVMFLLWKVLGSSAGLLGFFDYRAATIGDGICLPIFLGSVMVFRKYNQRLTDSEYIKCILIACLIAVLATGIQMSWLLRDDINPNWSIPMPHYFNVAGWYHSIFFIVVFGITAYQLSGLWFVLRSKKTKYTWFEKNVLLAFVTFGSLFVLLFISDDYEKVLPLSYLFSGTIIVLFVFLFLLLKSAGKVKKDNNILFSVLVGLVSAFGYGLLICGGLQGGDIFLALGGAISTCFLWRSEKFNLYQMIYINLWTIPCYFGIMYVASSLTNIVQIICILLVSTICSILIEKICIGEIRSRNLAMMSVSLYIILNKISFEMTTVLDSVFLVIIYVLFKKEIQTSFQAVTVAEENFNKGKLDKRSFGLKKAETYIQIALGVVAVTILICRWLIEIALSKGEKIPIGEFNLDIILILGLLFLLSLLGILGSRVLRKYKVSKVLALSAAIMLFAALVMSILRMVNIPDVTGWNTIQWGLLGCSGFACIGAPIMVAQGYYVNLVTLRESKQTKVILFSVAVQLIGCFVMTGSIILLIISEVSFVRLAVALVSAIIGYIVIPILEARVLIQEYKISHVIPNTPIGGIAQDGFMITLIIIFVIIMPCTYIRVMRSINFDVIFGAFTLISAAFLPVGFCLKNNVKHLERQREVLKEYPNEEMVWSNLQMCLRRQSLQTILTMLPYVIIIIAGLFGSGIIKNMTLKEIVGNLKSTYLGEND